MAKIKGKLKRAGQKEKIEDLGKEWIKKGNPKVEQRLKDPFELSFENL